MLRPTPGDPRGAEQHHWNTGAKENQQLNPGGPSNRPESSGPKATKINSFMSGPSLSLTPNPPASSLSQNRMIRLEFDDNRRIYFNSSSEANLMTYLTK